VNAGLQVLWQQQTAEAHAAHENTEQDAKGDG
jgi:hypothetical protein